MRLLLALLLAQDETVAVPGTKVSFQLVRVPAGKLGEVPVGAFRMGKHEVSWEEYKAYVGDEGKQNLELYAVDGITRPTRALSYFGQTDCPKEMYQDFSLPAINARLHGAVGHCDWLSKITGRRFRLPTEAEWEYAARAGCPDAAPAALDEVAWHAGNSGKRSQQGGKKKPNAFGLHDMLGNVWEYCLDSGSPPEYNPVLRGGAWNEPASGVTFASRRTITPDWYATDPQKPKSTWWLTNIFHMGFRVVCVEDGVDAKDRAAYLPRIELKVLGCQEFKPQDRPGLGSWGQRLRGEVKNAGDRTIVELDLTVYYLDPVGKPHFLDFTGGDKPGRATFGRCHPVMVPLGKGEEARPLKPGETRAWTVEIPMSFDPEDEVDKKAFGVRVEALLFAPAK